MGLSGRDYRLQMQDLLPHGAAWPRHEAAVTTKLLDGLSEEFARVDARAWKLIDEAIPHSTSEMLTDWERVAGLPDNCSGLLAESQQGRRDDLVAKLISQGGQSRAYYKSLASAMGFQVEVREHFPFRVGRSRAGNELSNGGWRYAWTVLAPTTTVKPFRVGASAVGERLAIWGNAGLECRIRQNQPAHTKVHFSYGRLGAAVLLSEEGGAVLNPAGIGILLEST